MNKTLQFYKNLQEISIYLSLPFSLITIISGLLFTNQLFIRDSWLANKIFDTPTFIVITCYIISSLRIQTFNQNSSNKLPDILTISFLIVIIGFLIIFDTLIPNQIP